MRMGWVMRGVEALISAAVRGVACHECVNVGMRRVDGRRFVRAVNVLTLVRDCDIGDAWMSIVNLARRFN